MSDLSPHSPQFRSLYWSQPVRQLQQRIQNLKINSSLYIVGGAVRDAFLQLTSKDLDLATPTKAIQIARKIANSYDGDFFVMDEQRGVARILVQIDAQPLTIDVANFRGDDLLADLQGRDFTINAMAVDLQGDIGLLIDPLNGEGDAMQKIIRRCSPQSIADDPIRSLRAIRQSAQFQFRIEPSTIADIKQPVTTLHQISPERIRDELFDMLTLNHPAVPVKVLYKLGLLQQILPQIQDLAEKALPSPHVFNAWQQTIETMICLANIIETISYRRSDATAASFAYGMLAMQLDRYREALNEELSQCYPNKRTQQSLLMLAALLHRLDNWQQVVPKIADHLRLSNAEKSRLLITIEFFASAQNVDYQSEIALHRFWYAAGEGGIAAILLGLADYLATYGNTLQQDQWLQQVERALMMLFAYYQQYDTLVAPPPLINGHDLMKELRLSAGALIGDILDYLREQQVLGNVKDRRDALIYAQQYLENDQSAQ